jgi:hypothetical protein
MNQFRRQGYLTYSRKGILLHRDAIKDWLRHPSMTDVLSNHKRRNGSHGRYTKRGFEPRS